MLSREQFINAVSKAVDDANKRCCADVSEIYATDAALRADLDRLKQQLAAIVQELPETFYAGLSPLQRIVEVVRLWQKAITVNSELETKLAAMTKELEAAYDQQNYLADSSAEVLRLSKELAARTQEGDDE